MLYNTFVTAFRSLLKNRSISVINITGLALGFTSFLLIAHYVVDELSYDRHHLKHERIFRVNTDLSFGGAINAFAIAAPPLAEALEQNFAEVENAVRIMPLQNVRFKKGDEVVREDKVLYTDADVFDVFTLPLIQGIAQTALRHPGAIVLTASSAKKYFNTTDVLGKTLSLADDTSAYTITGVIEDMPMQSHFHADFFLPLQTFPSSRNTSFSQFTFHTYILLREGADHYNLEAKFPPFMKKQLGNDMNVEEFEKGGNYINIRLTPLTDIHLRSNLQRELEANGDIQYVYIFSAIALLILFLASINFVNLSTARYASRAREVGIRKVLGSLRFSIVMRFLIESVTLTVIASGIAILTAYMLLPFFNSVAGKSLALSSLNIRFIVPVLIAIIIVVGVASGFYPAFLLSAFQPVDVLKGKLFAGFKGSTMRNLLVTFQFSISTFMVIGTMVIYHQLKYIRNKDLGFDREQVLIIKNASALENPALLKDRVKTLSGVVNATLSGYLPTGGARWTQTISTQQETGFLAEYWLIDSDYIPTMGMTLLTGRNFSPHIASDSSALIVNETAAKLLGYYSKDVANEVVHVGSGDRSRDFNIIGVVKDFNFSSLHNNITPLMMSIGSDWTACLSIRAKNDQLPSLLTQIRSLWRQLAPEQEFDYSFMRNDFEALYNIEQRMEKLFMIFASLAIAIACLGLFGLSAYAAELRVREMSIRKILGASTTDLLKLLSLDFLRLIAISILIAIPLSWFAMEKWLQTFAYRDKIPAWIFPAAACSMIAIALFTISYQSFKAAYTNAAQALRNE